MPDNNGTADPALSGKADWIDLFRDGRGVYTVLINLGIGLHALDIFIITTIMPTVVADIGGLAYYTWATMLYMVGSITGAASGGYMRDQLGRRRLLAVAFLAGWVIMMLEILGGRMGEVRPVQVSGLTDNRVVVTVEKTGTTPEQYPRRPGMPAKRPL